MVPAKPAPKRGRDDPDVPRRALEAARVLLAEGERRSKPSGWREKFVIDLGRTYRVSPQSIRRMLRLLKHDDQDLLEAVADGRLNIDRALRLAGIEGQPSSPHGIKVSIGDSKNYVEFYHRAKHFPGSNVEKGRAFGIAERSYSYIEAVVLLAERTDLSPADARRCQDALATLEQTGQPFVAYKKIKDLAQRIWKAKQARNKPNPNIARFDQSLAVIEQVAHSAEGMVIPYLGPEAMKGALELVENSVTALRRLHRRIRETSHGK